jgi:hypothetical protein
MINKNGGPQQIRSTALHILFIAIFGGWPWSAANAQSDSASIHPKWVIDIGGSIGLFIPFHQPQGEDIFIGTNSITSVQFNYKEHLFARLEVGEISADFRLKNSLGGVNSDIKSVSNSINLALGGGYQSRVGKWQPFVYAGAGPSYVTVPSMTYEPSLNTVKYRNNASIKLQMNAGAGVNYYLSKSVILLFETKASSLINMPSNPSLTGISALVNIKITL